MLKNKLLTGTILGSLSLLIWQNTANSASFYLHEHSAYGQGNAHAGSGSKADSASTIMFNAAGLTEIEGNELEAALHGIYIDAEATNNGSTLTGNDGGNPYGFAAVPNLYATYTINEVLSFGLGITAPFGLVTDWDDAWFGRGDATRSELRSINVNPVVAYKATDWLSLGFGVSVQYADAELKSILGVTEIVLEGDSIDFGFDVSALLKPSENLNIGLGYRSGIDHELEGTFTNTGATAVFAEGKFPDIFTVSATYEVNDDWRVMADVNFFNWSVFEDITVRLKATGAAVPGTTDTQDYKDTFAVSVGAEYTVNEEWVVRMGMRYDESPVRDIHRSMRIPDEDRVWGSIGASYNYSDSLVLDGAFTYVYADDANISRTNAIAQNTIGSVEADTYILSLGLRYKH